MITTVLKFSEIKKDPVCLLGWNRPTAITRYGDVVAYVLTPERIDELLKAEMMLERIKRDQENLNKVMSDLPF